MATREPRPYSNPYLAGAALGLVLLAAFVIAGRGLGVSGAFASVAAASASAISPERAQDSAYLSRRLAGDGPWHDWLLFELAGVVLGAFLSAHLAGRFRIGVERGEHFARAPRLAMASAGGVVMGVGAVIAGGCTSGLALTGGSLLAAGSWIFIAAAFAAAYAVYPLLRKAWR